MRSVRFVLALILTSGGLSMVTAGPAHASCNPQKPQTCETCHINSISIGDDGTIAIDWSCP
ncbi:MAG: hypothetical protein ACRDJI_06145 [Actinomycetota bacterium]